MILMCGMFGYILSKPFLQCFAQIDLCITFGILLSDELLNDRSASVYYRVENVEGTNYSKHEVEQMMKIDSYQRKIDTCHL